MDNEGMDVGTPSLAEAEVLESEDTESERLVDQEILFRNYEEEHKKLRASYLRVSKAIGVLVILLIAFVGGYLCGHYIHTNKTSETSDNKTAVETAEQRKKILKEISNEKIQGYLEYFTSFPHIGGSNESHQEALYVAKDWESYGYGNVEIKEYNVLLSYPKQPGNVSLIYQNGSVIHEASGYEKVLEKSENDSRAVPPYNAFSASGQITAPLVYVNYGSRDDFLELVKRKINCSGHIAIVKYGKLFRGDKAKNAEEFKCVGLIMYTDPKDYAPQGQSPEKTFPNSWWLPATGVQRGTVLSTYGDPLTQGYPANEETYRDNITEADLPTIPVYPMSWSDAAYFLGSLKGIRAPENWQGGIQGLVYNITMGDSSNSRVKMNIQMKLEKRLIYDVIWVVKGAVEPDRLVILGNHRDAWVFGGADPSSGTASLMESARSLGVALKRGWRPRRSIVFCSWGAEEFGLMGSTEWVEDNFKLLVNKAVAYLNVDESVKGSSTLRVKASPLLVSALFTSAKEVQSPIGQSLFDVWLKNEPDKDRPYLPWVSTLGAGSDYAAIYDRLGVPSADLSYYDNTWHASSTPVYHSLHDTFYWMKTFVDPYFKINQAVARFWTGTALILADSLILPFNCTRYGDEMMITLQKTKTECSMLLKTHGINLQHLKKTINNFIKSTEKFHHSMTAIKSDDILAVRRINDRLMKLERAFINPEGLPGRPLVCHMIFAPSLNNHYAGSSFPGLTDSIAVANQTGKWESVKKQLSILDYFIQQATSVLESDVI